MTNTEFHAPIPAHTADDHTAPGFPAATAIDPRALPPRPRRPHRTVLVLALSVGTLVCSVVLAVLAFAGTGTAVPSATVGQKLTEQFGTPISCTDDLPAKVGATTTCTGTDDQGVHHIVVTATSVNGDQVDFTGTVQD